MGLATERERGLPYTCCVANWPYLTLILTHLFIMSGILRGDPVEFSSKRGGPTTHSRAICIANTQNLLRPPPPPPLDLPSSLKVVLHYQSLYFAWVDQRKCCMSHRTNTATFFMQHGFVLYRKALGSRHHTTFGFTSCCLCTLLLIQHILYCSPPVCSSLPLQGVGIMGCLKGPIRLIRSTSFAQCAPKCQSAFFPVRGLSVQFMH